MAISTATIGGVAGGLVATTCYNLGPALQKEALNQMPPLTSMSLPRQLSMVFASKRWVLGFFVAIVGFVPYSMGINLSGVATVQPLMGFGLVALVAYSYRRLGERLTPLSAIGLALLIVLPGLIVFAEVSPPGRSLVEPSTRTVFFVSMGAVLALSVLLGLLSRRLPILLAFPVGLLYALLPLCLQGGLGILSSSGNSLLRELGALLGNLFSQPRFYGTVGLFLFGLLTNVGGYYLAQIALQRTQIIRLGPLFNSVSVLSATTLGILIFEQRIGRPLLYLLALSSAVLGIVLVSSATARKASGS